MEYTTEVPINLPRKEVIQLFDSMENMYKWQPGLLRHNFIEGKPGEEGAITELFYDSKRGEFAMTETITKKALPDEFHTIYKAKGVYNEMFNYFTEGAGGVTIWKTVSIFKFKGIMAIMSLFMGSAFKKETLLSMERFKAFCENNTN